MVAVKICGLTRAEAVDAARQGGAAYFGFVFYPPSPRHLDPASFARLRGRLPADAACVGVFVNPSDANIAEVLEAAPLALLQLHGSESPERLVALRERFGLPLIKALSVGEPGDLAKVEEYRSAADMLLFDARPPKRPGMLPGGNAVRFDWRILEGFTVDRPWILAGGLNLNNLAEAVRRTAAPIVDVSSGVERSPGIKDPDRIRALLERARRLPEVGTGSRRQRKA